MKTDKIVKCKCGKKVIESKLDTGIERWEIHYAGICRPLHRCKYWAKEKKFYLK